MALTFEEQIASDVQNVFLNTAEFGRSITQYPRGSEGAKRSVVANWTPDVTPTRDASNEGESTTLGGTIQVAEAVACHGEDVWVIDGDARYATVTVSEVHGGMRTVTVQRVDKFATSRHRTKL